MLRAVFVRTLRPGVTYDDFKQAWAPLTGKGAYPAKAVVAHNTANDRQVITIIELDVPLAEFEAASASLTRPDARERLAAIVESTELAGIFEDVFDQSAL